MTQSSWIFLVIESTGLDPKGGDILEIALVAVDPWLNELAHWHSPVKPFHGDWRSRLEPRVREMHENSGLLGELLSERQHLKFEAGGFPTREQAEAVALQFVAAYGTPPDANGRPTVHLCGAKVGSFDRRWLDEHMPKLSEAFHYREVDSNFCFLSELHFTGQSGLKGETRHRALDDARQSILTVKRFFGVSGGAK